MKSRDEVRKTLEELKRRLRVGESTILEISEDVLEFIVDEAVRQRLSVVDAREEDHRVIVVIERRHG